MNRIRKTRAHDPKSLPVKDRYGLLVGTVAPRPIALASTVDSEGRPNLAPFSYFNVFSIDPPMLMVGPTLRGRDGTVKDTLANARETGEIVINLVDHAMVVPGSGLVKEQAEEEGLDKIMIEAGMDWRQPGCSMCLAMNPDKLGDKERCASTSNRNFEGRQGQGGRTHLVAHGDG